MEWETVIGLEVHVQLATQTKIFSGSSTAFGAAPNSQANAIDLAMPGTLPSPNRQAFEYAVMFGLAIDADIGKRSVFERKNYFYPDLPKGYQTTQLAEPIVGAGVMSIETEHGEKSVRIHHAHLEEDAGKSVHDAFHGYSGIDLNRAGTPLIEVVTEPDMRNADEAVAFAKKLHSLVTSLGICDGNMSQGSMRFDVNISVRPKGQEAFGTRTETKNLNSFRFMEACIEQEVERQIELIEGGGSVKQQTRLYDGDTHTAKPMRDKEEANDYRYFPCPDLLPVILEDDFIEKIRRKIPELPEARQKRYESEFKLSTYDAGILSGDRDTARYFEAVVQTCQDAKLAANWVISNVAAQLNASEQSISTCPISAENLGYIIRKIKDGTLSSKSAKTVFEKAWQGETDIDAIIESVGTQISDSGILEKLVDEVIANNTKQVDNFRKADEKKQPKMLGFFVGQVMKASKGQANPKTLNEILLKKLKG